MKFCGLKRPEDVDGARAACADYVGFNFVEKSPRYVSPEAVSALADAVGPGILKVGLVVDAGDAALARLVATGALDMLQLHGAETPARVRDVKAKFGLPVVKVIGVAEAGDLEAVARYGTVADQLLVDAKPPKGADLPGGNGVSFDWTLLRDVAWPLPWMLAGGLTAENVAEAVRITGAPAVDLASGIESAPGVKDAGKMQAFAAALRGG